MKINKGADEAGLVAELLKKSLDDFQADLLHLFNDILYTGNFPSCWSRALFQMLAKTARAQQPSDYRPIANIRFFFFSPPLLFDCRSTRGETKTKGQQPARYVQRASATMSASGGVSAPALGTAVAGSSRRELLKAVLAATVNIWPQRRCKAWASAALASLSHVLKHEETFGSLCSSGPPPRAQGLPACSVLAARTPGKCDFCAPRLRMSAGAGAAITLDGTHQRDVNGYLRTVEGWEAVGNDLQASGVSDGQPQV